MLFRMQLQPNLQKKYVEEHPDVIVRLLYVAIIRDIPSARYATRPCFSHNARKAAEAGDDKKAFQLGVPDK